MSVLADPTGAVFALWQSLNPMGTFVWRETNSMCWQELTDQGSVRRRRSSTPRCSAGRRRSVPMGEFDYTLLYNGKEQVAGLMPQPKPMVEGNAPSLWTVYFEVADCDATVRARDEARWQANPPADRHSERRPFRDRERPRRRSVRHHQEHAGGS